MEMGFPPISRFSKRRTILPSAMLLGILCLFFADSAQASGRIGGTALNLGVGARAEAMGGAFVAVADDASALFWNPGALGQIRGAQFSGTHTEWLGGIRYESVGFAQPIGKWATLGVGGKFLYGGDVSRTVRTASGYEEQGVFNFSTRHIQFGVGSGQVGQFRFGGGLELLREGLHVSAATTDTAPPESRVSVAHVGGIYETPVNGLKLGAAIRNLGGSAASDPTPVPRLFQLGAAYAHRIETVPAGDLPLELGQGADAAENSPTSILTLALDTLFLREESPALRLGAEYRFQNGFAMRGGYRTDAAFDFASRLSGGLGYATNAYGVDYAFLSAGDLGNVHRASFTLLFR